MFISKNSPGSAARRNPPGRAYPTRGRGDHVDRDRIGPVGVRGAGWSTAHVHRKRGERAAQRNGGRAGHARGIPQQLPRPPFDAGARRQIGARALDIERAAELAGARQRHHVSRQRGQHDQQEDRGGQDETGFGARCACHGWLLTWVVAYRRTVSLAWLRSSVMLTSPLRSVAPGW